MRYFGPIFSALIIFLAPTLALADFECPKKMAIIEKGVISPAVGDVMKAVYLKLGCPVTFEAVPGLRGIQWFNSHEVDGELMRLPAAEASYERKFVRSSTPLFSLTYSLWLRPGQATKRTLPIGYSLGVIWHNEYVKGKRATKFHNPDAMIEAYNAGRISGMLIADLSAVNLADEGLISPRPEKSDVVARSPMYHYLGTEFSPFMARFSALVKAEDPFSLITKMQE